MIRTRVLVVAALLASLAPIFSHGQSSQTNQEPTAKYADGLRRWTPRVSIGVRYFVDYWNDGGKPIVSPDGSKFLVVTTHGDVLCDCETFELAVFTTKDVLEAIAQGRSVQPTRTVVRKSSHHRGGTLWLPTWEKDNESIVFDSIDERDIQQRYRYSVRTGELKALTKWPYDVFAQNAMGDTYIGQLSKPAPALPSVYPSHVVTREELNNASFPGDPAIPRFRIFPFVSYRDGKPWQLKSASSLREYFAPVFSSDGRLAVASAPPKVVPDSWEAEDGYDNIDGPVVSQFIFMDAPHSDDYPVLAAPLGNSTTQGAEAAAKGLYPRALWVADDKHLVLINAALPLDSKRYPERARSAYILGYNIADRQWNLIEPLVSENGGALCRVTQAGWLTEGKELWVGHEVGGKPAPGTVYVLQGDQWVGHAVDATVGLPKWTPPVAPTLVGGLLLSLRQSANDPPVLVASDGHKEIKLTEPDPALQGIWMAREEPFEWKEQSGATVKGGLLLPRDAKLGPVPLIIDAYTYEPETFNPDGPATHAYAAQALVARGMAVLVVNIPGEGGEKEDVTGTLKEGSEFADRVNSAIQTLAGRGIIDPARVGIVGFSRAGFNAYYVITHPGKHPLAAAVIDDAFTGNFASYLFDYGEFASTAQSYEGLYGGSFWKHKQTWLDIESSFNVDRVQTPALFSIHSHEEIPLYATDLGAFGLNHRPLEYILYPEATHQLKMSRQRLASNENTVEWMAYWLNGEVPPDAMRARRWARLRKQQEAVLDSLKAEGTEVTTLPELKPTVSWAVAEWQAVHAAISKAAK